MHPVLEPVSFDRLPGWRAGHQGAALEAFNRSCRKMASLPARRNSAFAPAAAPRDWRAACRAAAKLDPANDTAARFFFERRFVPYRIVTDRSAGLFTGYYEAELRGSWHRTRRFNVPIYKKPKDLIAVDLGRFSSDWKGKRIVGRVHGRRLVPYFTRGEIERGALRGKGRVLLWVDSAVDAFFLHVQGSGRVAMNDGTVVRVGFAARNGRPYVAIGRVLVKRGAIPKDHVSMQSIRRWLTAHPREARTIMAANPSYIFFRRLKGTEPRGAEGVALTPGRSLAVDRRFVPLGTPLWLATRQPLDPARPLRRLVIAQDTGSAIKGPVRGDLFWGHGAKAAARAGHMKAPGTYYLLLPRAGCC